MHLIEVAFKGNRKEFFAWDGEDPPPVQASIVVEADRGEDLGLVHAVGERAASRNAGCAHGCGTTPPARKALRLASSREACTARPPTSVSRTMPPGAKRRNGSRPTGWS